MKFNKQLINTLLTIFLFNSVNAENQGEELILTPGPISGKYDSIDLEELYDEKSIGIHCNGNSCISTGSSVLVEEGKVTITNAGTYIFDGDLKGQLNVKAKKNDFVHLVLRNATISSDNGPAFYGEKAKKIIITTEGENVFNDSTNYPAVAVSEDAAEDETKSPNACIYVNDNLTFNGKGSLSVDGKFDEAIRSKKAIKFVSGKIDVNAKGKGIKAKNSISIKEADINVKAGNSGIKVTKDDDPEKGFIVIDGGKVVVKCDNDGIHAETHLSINGGYIEVKECAEGIEGQMIDITDGDIVVRRDIDDNDSDEEEAADVGSSVEVAEEEDSNDEEEITVTEYYTTTIAVEEEPTQTENTEPAPIDPFKDPNGPPSDDDPFKDPKGPPVKSRKNDKQVYIRVTGGKLRLYVDGFNTDGLDANGSLYIGGNAQIYIDNAEGDIFGNMCALDSDGSNTIDNGATMFNGSGPAGPVPEGPAPEGPIPEGPVPEEQPKEETVSLEQQEIQKKPEDNSYIKQPYLRTLFNYEKEIGDEIVVKDSKGEIIHTYKPRTKFTEVLVTSPKIIEGETYSVIYGDHIRTLEAKVDYEEPVYPDDEI
ncbi:hypothetical protein BCR36DRAFT_413782 [Piromyces finnis]|uniref:Carbohydrate-binding domain-containing protein n=1 Tax=Piromyces finnis TaxID=1754191 RepID=A0A1Y1V496_9FUNG|nr:hypothetical protein BCR36DRAFT_413782 [Piromyces finnis]|eukprot:ORX46830.1 hypothetical protein BCR36DRAFT_413782 [Piromyces finnis]